MKFAVVSHVSRRQQASVLAAQLGAAIFEDDGSLGEWNNHARAWQWLARSGAEWCCVLQDDALPVAGFTEALTEGLRHLPTEDAVVSLYLGTGYPLQWQGHVRRAVAEGRRQGAAWVQGRGLLHGVGVCLRHRHIGPMLRVSNTLPYDEHIGAYAIANALPTYYTLPSLVDHADTDSVVIHADGLERKRKRVAHCVGVPVWNRDVSHL